MSQKNFIIGTAGHIDHGKTTLIKALSGTDTDRLSEEKERGISIDLGFTDLKLNDQYTLGIVDVPGHEKFIKNMLAGAGGVDIALLVIAADEGVMPQTREHLDILSLLNVQKGLIAVTKIDMVEDEWVELMVEEIREKLSDTFLSDSPIIPVSATEGIGLEKLKNQLIKTIESMETKEITGNVYYPIDRVFTIKGHGTITTGTLVSGKINVDDNLLIYPSHKEVRVRSIEVHGKDSEAAYPGQRVGINLSGIDKDEIERGDVLATPDSLINTKFLDGRLTVLKNAPLVVEHGDRIRFHIGAKEVIGRLYLLDKKELLPGERGLVQYRLEEEVVARYNENYVIRRYSPMTTIGGGNIIDTHPHLRKRFKEDVIEELNKKEELADKERVEYICKLAQAETVTYDYLIKKTSIRKDKIKEILQELNEEDKVKYFQRGNEKTWIHVDNYQELAAELLEILEKFHGKNRLKAGLSKEELRTRLSSELDNKEYNQFLNGLEKREKIEVKGSYVKKFAYQVNLNEKEKKLRDEILKEFKENKFMPPNVEDIIEPNSKKEEVFEYLIDNGKIVHLREDLFFLSSAVKEAKELLINHLEEKDTITLAEFRDKLDSSRKYTLALLEYFDQQNITKRVGEERTLTK
ncbi:MAG TPA: selenocysteine-specific translation elongation factor [Halanaerobiales bacterium]|nr:selenocysteine-specific translation elongation factor [Halanaerobiales bacterium]